MAADHRPRWRAGSLYASSANLRLARGLEIRSEITTSLALSPDGRYLAAAAVTIGRSRLWLRRSMRPNSRLPGHRGRVLAVLVSDSRFIGFGAEGKLKKSRGERRFAAHHLRRRHRGRADVEPVRTILFADLDLVHDRGIMSVSADGGTPAPVTTTGGTIGHNWPHFLPDGRHFLFSADAREGRQAGTLRMTLSSVRSMVLNRKPLSTVSVSRSSTRVGASAFVNDGTLLAQRFDLDSLPLIGEPTSWPKAFDCSNRQARRGLRPRRRGWWRSKQSPITRPARVVRTERPETARH